MGMTVALSEGSSVKTVMTVKQRLAEEAKETGMSLEQRLTETAEENNGLVCWYFSRTEAMEALFEKMKSPTAETSADVEFLIRCLASQLHHKLDSMDDVRALIYLKDNYHWMGEASVTNNGTLTFSMINVLAEHAIPCIILVSDSELKMMKQQKAVALSEGSLKTGMTVALSQGSSAKTGLTVKQRLAEKAKETGMSLEQRLTEKAEKNNGLVCWYFSRTEAMEALFEKMKSPTAETSEDVEFLIRCLALQFHHMLDSMDDVRALIYLKDNYHWMGKASVTNNGTLTFSMINALAEHEIPCFINISESHMSS